MADGRQRIELKPRIRHHQTIIGIIDRIRGFIKRLADQQQITEGKIDGKRIVIYKIRGVNLGRRARVIGIVNDGVVDVVIVRGHGVGQRKRQTEGHNRPADQTAKTTCPEKDVFRAVH